jgi:hypothetical protein
MRVGQRIRPPATAIGWEVDLSDSSTCSAIPGSRVIRLRGVRFASTMDTHTLNSSHDPTYHYTTPEPSHTQCLPKNYHLYGGHPLNLGRSQIDADRMRAHGSVLLSDCSPVNILDGDIMPY